MSYKYDYLDEFVYPHPLGTTLTEGGKLFTFRGQEYTVTRITMSAAGSSLYDYKHDIEIYGNEGSKFMRGIKQNGIGIFHSCCPDIGDTCVYPIPESYPGILNALNSTIEYLYTTGHASMHRTNGFN